MTLFLAFSSAYPPAHDTTWQLKKAKPVQAEVPQAHTPIFILLMLLLLLLSHISRVRLCGTPYTAAHQAPPSLGFSRQEYWSGLPFPSPMHENDSEVAQSCLTPSDPMDYSLPGSSILGIFQATVLEWGAFSENLCDPEFKISQLQHQKHNS